MSNVNFYICRRFFTKDFPNYRGKIMRVGEFGNYDVPDPYSKDINAFHESFDLISKGLDEIGRHVIHPENRERNAS